MKSSHPKCVQWQHQGGDLIYEATKDMTREEVVAWWQEEAKTLRRARAERMASKQPAEASTVGD